LIAIQPDFGEARGPVDDHANVERSGQTPPSPVDPELPPEPGPELAELPFAPELPPDPELPAVPLDPELLFVLELPLELDAPLEPGRLPLDPELPALEAEPPLDPEPLDSDDVAVLASVGVVKLPLDADPHETAPATRAEQTRFACRIGLHSLPAGARPGASALVRAFRRTS